MIIVYATFPDTDTARKITDAVIAAKLAACANIAQTHEAVYEWDGVVQREQEVAVIFKTTQEKFEELKAEILKHHPYDTPCIVTLPITDGYEPFLEWISGQVSK